MLIYGQLITTELEYSNRIFFGGESGELPT